MNRQVLLLPCSTLMLALAVLFAPTGADAAPASRNFRGHATLFCQGALPAFETAIRKRPLAVQNEGTSTAFVTCSFLSQGEPSFSFYNFATAYVYVSSTSGSDIVVNCTGVAGTTTQNSEYVVRSATAPANGNQIAIFWIATDFAGSPDRFPSGLFSVSCQLPPGAAINYLRAIFSEEIGT